MNRAADSPSPLNGARAGLRGKKVREASSLQRSFMGSAYWDHEPPITLFSLSSPEGGEGWGEEGRFSPRFMQRIPRKKISRIQPMNRTADSPSPLKGERAGVRGETVREASSLERRFMGRAAVLATTKSL